MKKVKSLNDIQNIINEKWDIKQDINGKMYNLHIVNLLQMSLIDLISMINEGRLFYNPEN